MTTVINNTTKKPASLEVNDDGELLVAGAGGGGGGGGDASAANQVTGNAILTAIDGHVDGLEASATTQTARLTSILAVLNGVDSIGNALPEDFDFLAATYGYTGADLTTIVKTKGANTWTQTLTYSSGALTATSKWVKV